MLAVRRPPTDLSVIPVRHLPDGDSGKYNRLPEGNWPFCKRCFCEVHPLYADVQTIIDRYDRIKQVLVHSSCNWYVREA